MSLSDTKLIARIPWSSKTKVSNFILPPDATFKGCYKAGTDQNIMLSDHSSDASSFNVGIDTNTNEFDLVVQNGKNEKRYTVRIERDRMNEHYMQPYLVLGKIPIPEDAEEIEYFGEKYRVVRNEADFYKIFDSDEGNYILANGIRLKNPPSVAFENRNFGTGDKKQIIEGNKFGVFYDIPDNGYSEQDGRLSFFHTIGRNGVFQNFELSSSSVVLQSKICAVNYGLITGVSFVLGEALIPSVDGDYAFIANYNYGTVQYCVATDLEGNGYNIRRQNFDGNINFAPIVNYNRGLIQGCVTDGDNVGAEIANTMEGGYTEYATIRRCYSRESIRNFPINQIDRFINVSESEEAVIRKNNKRYKSLNYWNDRNF